MKGVQVQLTVRQRVLNRGRRNGSGKRDIQKVKRRKEGHESITVDTIEKGKAQVHRQRLWRRR